MVRVLFVCLGNICRSTMAEGLLNHLLEEAGLQDKVAVDSAGTSAYHIGELADYRTRKVLSDNKIALHHKARQITEQDFDTFDYILAADKSNIENILKIQPPHKGKATIQLIRHFDPKHPDTEVPDPYYGGMGDFEDVYQLLEDALEPFVEHLKSKITTA